MFSYELIEAYMKTKNYTQAKQAAIDLGFSNSFVTKLKTGEKKIADESAIYIAERCGMDVHEVLIQLQAEKARTEHEKETWLGMLKKYKHGINPTMSIIISGLLLQFSNVIDFALCNLLLNKGILKHIQRGPKRYIFGAPHGKQTYTVQK